MRKVFTILAAACMGAFAMDAAAQQSAPRVKKAAGLTGQPTAAYQLKAARSGKKNAAGLATAPSGGQAAGAPARNRTITQDRNRTVTKKKKSSSGSGAGGAGSAFFAKVAAWRLEAVERQLELAKKIEEFGAEAGKGENIYWTKWDNDPSAPEVNHINWYKLGTSNLTCSHTKDEAKAAFCGFTSPENDRIGTLLATQGQIFSAFSSARPTNTIRFVFTSGATTIEPAPAPIEFEAFVGSPIICKAQGGGLGRCEVKRDIGDGNETWVRVADADIRPADTVNNGSAFFVPALTGGFVRQTESSTPQPVPQIQVLLGASNEYVRAWIPANGQTFTCDEKTFGRFHSSHTGTKPADFGCWASARDNSPRIKIANYGGTFAAPMVGTNQCQPQNADSVSICEITSAIHSSKFNYGSNNGAVLVPRTVR